MSTELIAGGAALPATALQRRLWFVEQYNGDRPQYNIAYGWRIRGPLDPTALSTALAQVVARHESLRTTFAVAGGALVQVVQDTVDVPLPVIDIDGESRIEAESAAEVTRRFDLAAGPLLRARLLRLAPQDHTLLLTTHHTVVDGQSMDLVRAELAALYQAYRTGTGAALPAVACQYPDVAASHFAALDGGQLAGHARYWAELLAGTTAGVGLPFARPLPLHSHRSAATVPFSCGTELTGRLREIAAENRTSVSTVLLAVLFAVIARCRRSTDNMIGLPVTGRTRPELQQVVGMCTNTLPLRLRLDDDPSLAEVLSRTRSLTLDAQDHQDLPFPLMRMGWPAQQPAGPMAQILYTPREGRGTELHLAGCAVTALPPGALTTNNELTFAPGIAGGAGEISGQLVYQVERLDAGVVTAIAEDLVAVARTLASDGSRRLAQLPVRSYPAGSGPARPDLHRADQPAGTDPAGAEVLQRLVGILRELLGLPDIPPDTNLFDLGLDSVRATELVARLHRDAGLALWLPALYRTPTAEGVAAGLRPSTGER